MTSPVVTHPVCDLDMQRRLREARMAAVARSLGRAKRYRGLLDRLFRLKPRRQVAADALAFRDPGEDVWKALRF